MEAADTTTQVAVPSLPAAPPRVEADRTGARVDRPRSVAVLEPAPGGAAERLANRLGETRPVRVFLATIFAGYALLVALTVAAGLLLTRLLVPVHGFEKWDNDVNRWLAERRTPFLTDLSWLGSTLAGGLVIPVLVGLLLLVFVLRRSWLLAAFTLFVISVESGTYRATTLVVHRDRPPVHRLEGLAPDASFPSGHIAATVALYGGLLLLLSSWVGRRWFSAIAWTVTLGLVLFVGWARMYRGMHHVTDLGAGVVMGLAVLSVAVLAARAATAASSARDAARGDAS